MDILILSQYWYPENGVPQRRWSWLARVLADEGHSVTVIAPPPHYERSIGLGEWLRTRGSSGRGFEYGPSEERIIRSQYLPAGQSLTARALNQGVVALGMMWTCLRRPSALKDYRPDVVIGTVPAIPTAFAAPFVAAIMRAPYVIDLRDAWPDLLSERHQWNSGTGSRSMRERILTRGPVQLLSSLVRTLMYESFRRASGLILTAASLEEDLLTRPELKGRRPLTATVRNVFPPATVYQAADKADRPSDSLNVLYAGTLGRAQKLQNALDAVKLAADQGVRVRLRMVGAGATRTELERKIAEENIDAELLGRVSADDLYPHYEWADTALVHLTGWGPLERAIPSKTYELMNSGIHITGVVAGEAAELITGLRCGVAVTPDQPQELADLWVSLARDRSQLAISPEGRDWVERERRTTTPTALLTLLERIRAAK